MCRRWSSIFPRLPGALRILIGIRGALRHPLVERPACPAPRRRGRKSRKSSKWRRDGGRPAAATDPGRPIDADRPPATARRDDDDSRP
eukprot:6934619-Pyramimonas_sp.AAC.1